MHEAICNYNVTESNNLEFDDFNSADVSNNQQELNSTEIELRGNNYLSSELKKTFTSTFKTALEIRNEETLQMTTSIKNKDQLNKLFSKDVEISHVKNQTSIINDTDATQKNTYKDNISQTQTSNGFVCAREIHESNKQLLKPNASSSKLKDCRSKTDKSVKKTGKTVYEQILKQARSSSDVIQKIPSESPSISSKTKESKVIDNIVDCIKKENKSESKGKNKRSREPIECQEDDTRLIKKRRARYSESNDKIDNYVSDKNIEKKFLDDKVDMETVRNIMDKNDTITSTDIIRKDKLKKHLEIATDLELKVKKESAHATHSKHKSSRMKVPADKVTQFKTAEILKSYLMKYYPSERLPDKATFSKTCREMHYNMLSRKIFGKIYLIYKCLRNFIIYNDFEDNINPEFKKFL